jgi:hypothetical protein
MQQRTFYVALGVPREADTEHIRLAYRRVVARYRHAIESIPEPFADDPTPPPLNFAIMRSYSDRRHGTLFDQPEPLIPTNDNELDRFCQGFVPEVIDIPKAKRSGKDLFVELRLSPNQAKGGGMFTVHIPVIKPCPTCSALDEPRRLTCRLCGGTHRITEDRTIEITTPPGVMDGQVARLPMEDVGLACTDLVVYVVVS